MRLRRPWPGCLLTTVLIGLGNAAVCVRVPPVYSVAGVSSKAAGVGRNCDATLKDSHRDLMTGIFLLTRQHPAQHSISDKRGMSMSDTTKDTEWKRDINLTESNKVILLKRNWWANLTRTTPKAEVAWYHNHLPDLKEKHRRLDIMQSILKMSENLV